MNEISLYEVQCLVAGDDINDDDINDYVGIVEDVCWGLGDSPEGAKEDSIKYIKQYNLLNEDNLINLDNIVIYKIVYGKFCKIIPITVFSEKEIPDDLKIKIDLDEYQIL